MIRSRRAVRRLLVVAATLVLLLLGGVYFGVPLIIPGGLVSAPNANLTIDGSGDPDSPSLARLGIDQQRRVEVGPPWASLSVWTIGDLKRRPLIVLLHGIRDSKRSMAGLGRRLAGEGYAVALVDLRGHGRSSGKFLTYGVQEAHDLSQVLDALGPVGPVGVLGHSYGAAVGLQLAARDRRVRAVVAVASFKTLRDVAHLYVRRYLSVFRGLLSSRTIDHGIDEGGRLAGFDPEQASPLRAVPSTEAAVLLIHGAEDGKIPAAHSRALYAAAREPKRLVLIEGEGHDSVMRDRSGRLLSETLAWFRRWLPGAGAGSSRAPGQ